MFHLNKQNQAHAILSCSVNMYNFIKGQALYIKITNDRI